MALPLLMMLLLVVALFGASLPVITFVIAIALWPEVARLTRSLVLVEREKPYVAAARVLGLHRVQILIRHVVPNIVKQASLVVLLLLAQAVLVESALSYLGVGPERPRHLGRIISDGQNYITTSWWPVTLPGLVIVLLVLESTCSETACATAPAGRKEGMSTAVREAPQQADTSATPLLDVRNCRSS